MEACDFSAAIFFKMFDAQIKLMLLYGSEIWGLKEYKSVEKVHTFALKKLLNMSPRTGHMERQVVFYYMFIPIQPV